MGFEVATKGASTSAAEETDRPSRGREGGPSLNSLALVRKATTPDNILSDHIENWHLVARDGVLLKENTQKFWVDEELHKNCFLVFPKACDIVGGNEESCWSWITKEEKCFNSIIDIPVPKSEKLDWLLIQGRFKTRVLSPNTQYEVRFVVQCIRCFFLQLELELDLPDGTKKTKRPEPMESESEYRWEEVLAGKFTMDPKTVGTISFALRGWLDPEKTALIFKGVLIRPVCS